MSFVFGFSRMLFDFFLVFFDDVCYVLALFKDLLDNFVFNRLQT